MVYCFLSLLLYKASQQSGLTCFFLLFGIYASACVAVGAILCSACCLGVTIALDDRGCTIHCCAKQALLSLKHLRSRCPYLASDDLSPSLLLFFCSFGDSPFLSTRFFTESKLHQRGIIVLHGMKARCLWRLDVPLTEFNSMCAVKLILCTCTEVHPHH